LRGKKKVLGQEKSIGKAFKGKHRLSRTETWKRVWQGKRTTRIESEARR